MRPINEHVMNEMKVTVLEDGQPVHKIKGSPKSVKAKVLDFFKSKY